MKILLTTIFDLILIILSNLIVRDLNREEIMKDIAIAAKYCPVAMDFLVIKCVEVCNLFLFVSFLFLEDKTVLDERLFGLHY